MPSVDAAGRPVGRGLHVAESDGPVFVVQPPNSTRSGAPVIVLRQDVHLRGLAAARRTLRDLPSQLSVTKP